MVLEWSQTGILQRCANPGVFLILTWSFHWSLAWDKQIQFGLSEIPAVPELVPGAGSVGLIITSLSRITGHMWRYLTSSVSWPRIICIPERNYSSASLSHFPSQTRLFLGSCKLLYPFPARLMGPQRKHSASVLPSPGNVARDGD